MKILNVKLEKDIVRGVLILLGTIIGAGIFSLPYFSSNIGFLFLLILLYSVLINYYLSYFYLKMFLKTNASRFEEIPLKLGNKKLFYITHFLKYLTIYLASLIYLTGIPDVIRNLLLNFFQVDVSINLLRVILIFVLFIVLLLNVRSYSKIESYLVGILIGFIFLLIFYLFFNLNFSKIDFFSINDNIWFKFFFALGPFLFASMDTTTTPEVYKILNYNYKKMKKVLILTYSFIFILYVLFIISFLGVFGNSVEDNAVKSLFSLSKPIYVIGIFIVILAMITSLLNFSYLMVDSLVDLHNLDRLKANLVVILPLFLSLLLPKNYGVVVGVLGSLSILFMIGLIVILSIYVDIKLDGHLALKKPISLFARAIILLSILIGFITEIFK